MLTADFHAFAEYSTKHWSAKATIFAPTIQLQTTQYIVQPGKSTKCAAASAQPISDNPVCRANNRDVCGYMLFPHQQTRQTIQPGICISRNLSSENKLVCAGCQTKESFCDYAVLLTSWQTMVRGICISYYEHNLIIFHCPVITLVRNVFGL